jgi:hypothetical protein
MVSESNSHGVEENGYGARELRLWCYKVNVMVSKLRL